MDQLPHRVRLSGAGPPIHPRQAMRLLILIALMWWSAAAIAQSDTPAILRVRSTTALMNLQAYHAGLEADTNKARAEVDRLKGRPFKSRPTPHLEASLAELKKSYAELMALASNDEQRSALKEWRVSWAAAFQELRLRGSISPESERMTNRHNAALELAFE